MPVLVKSIAFWTGKIFFAVIAFLLSALVANTFLSYILPRIFAESPRRETSSLDTWVVVGKHGLTLVVSAWAGISTGENFLEPRLREGRSGAKLESKGNEGRPFPSLWQKIRWQNRKGKEDRREEEGTEARNPFESHTALWIPLQRPSTPAVDTTIQDWTIYEEHFGKPLPFALITINNESDGLSQSLADDASEWNLELRQRYDSKH